MSFQSLGLEPALLTTLAAQDFSTPTPIQAQAIPAILTGRDLLGIARTGSGKTAAYLLPLLQKLRELPSKHREPQILILVPTRELAHQVLDVASSFLPTEGRRPICKAVFGGVSVNPQMQSLTKVDLLVATPGRLLDLVERNALSLKSVAHFVLDEADKMLNLGFQVEVSKILALLPPQRQNLLFSATFGDELSEIQSLTLTDPEIVKIDTDETDEVQIKELAYSVPDARKGPLLRYLIKSANLPQTLVFAGSAHRVDQIANKLEKNKIPALAMHSKLSQQARRHALEDFKRGHVPVLVATDLLSRGVDIEGLPLVVQYELPRSAKDYVHRIGRTGRADASGEAISLVNEAELAHFKVIQKKLSRRIPLHPSDEINLHGY